MCGFYPGLRMGGVGGRELTYRRKGGREEHFSFSFSLPPFLLLSSILQ
jgi:hypothetical protein